MTSKGIVLETLQHYANVWVPSQWLVEAGAGYRYAARIYELRKAGYVIEERRDPTGRSALGEYRLVDERQLGLGLAS